MSPAAKLRPAARLTTADQALLVEMILAIVDQDVDRMISQLQHGEMPTEPDADIEPGWMLA